MLKDYGMLIVSGIDQLFIRRTVEGSIGLLVEKVVDDFFISGSRSSMDYFLNQLDSNFKLGASSIGINLRFLGCEIEVYSDAQEKRCVHVSMCDYLRRVRPIQVSKYLKSSPNLAADDQERS